MPCQNRIHITSLVIISINLGSICLAPPLSSNLLVEDSVLFDGFVCKTSADDDGGGGGGGIICRIGSSCV